MAEVNDGGPAFPQSKDSYRFQMGDNSLTPSGMTLRDWFAGQALSGLMADEHVLVNAGAAKMAYELADAMLAERSKGNGVR